MTEAILANIARTWNRAPSGVAQGSRSGVSAALWTSRGRGSPQVVGAEPDLAQHIVCIEQARVRASLSLNGRSQPDKWRAPGEVVLVPAGASAEGIREGQWAMLHLYVPDALLHHLADEDGTLSRSGPLELVSSLPGPDPVISRIGQEVLSEMHSGLPLARLRVDALGQDLAIRLLRVHSNLPDFPASTVRGGLALWQVRRACDAMEARLDGNIGLNTLAGLAGVSPAYFSRAFKQSVGVPPFTWLLQRRVERAQELLTDPAFTLTEVALAVGFAAQSQFTTAFKRLTGTTPGAWRRERLR